MIDEFITFVKKLYPQKNTIQLHEPVFLGKEKEYVIDCIDSSFVSYVGKYVTKFENITAEFTGSKYAVAVVNGTTALQVSLEVAGVKYNDEVITQPLTFIATVNAIAHCGAIPVFVDVDLDTMGMSPGKLENFLKTNCVIKDDKCINKYTGRIIKAVVPVHTFGHPCRIDEIIETAKKYHLIVIEDAAESIGSYYKGKHTGTFGLAGILSYNGNKTITTGGGGMIITNNEEFASKAKHITTTGKVPHKWEYVHNIIAYNFRLTNVNAAIGVAQMERIHEYLVNKRETAILYRDFFKQTNTLFFSEPKDSRSNYWLNVIQLGNIEERDNFLKCSNEGGIITRPVWKLINTLEMYKNNQVADLSNAKWLEERIVNIPSGYRG